LVGLFYIFFILKEEDIVIDLNRNACCNHAHAPEKIQWINWKVLIWVAGVIILGNYIKTFDKEMIEIVTNSGSIAIAALLSFLFSFAMGSSSKYAGFVALLTKIFGIKFLPLFLAIDYAGYMFSPTHKCFTIGKTYFDTPILEFYKAIGLLCSSLLVVALIITFA
jgi:hypothetical protein